MVKLDFLTTQASEPAFANKANTEPTVVDLFAPCTSRAASRQHYDHDDDVDSNSHSSPPLSMEGCDGDRNSGSGSKGEMSTTKETAITKVEIKSSPRFYPTSDSLDEGNN